VGVTRVRDPTCGSVRAADRVVAAKLDGVTEPQPFSRDTSPDVQRMLVARFRTMTTAEKAQLVDSLTRGCEALALAGIRMRHPDATAEELRLRLGALRMGRDLVLAVYGWDPGEGRR